MRESKLWIFFIFAGLIMFVFAGIHMFYQHMGSFLAFFGYETGNVLEYKSVMERGASMGWGFFYMVLLTVALYHGLYGVRAIVIELIPKQTVLISRVILIIGIIAFVFGTFVIVEANKMGGVM